MERKLSKMKKVVEQHFIQEIDYIAIIDSEQKDLTEILFDDGSTELWIIFQDNYNEEGKLISTCYYKGFDVIGEYFYEDGTRKEKKIRW